MCRNDLNPQLFTDLAELGEYFFASISHIVCTTDSDIDLERWQSSAASFNSNSLVHSFKDLEPLSLLPTHPQMTFHDLRHTCATRLGDRGASAFEIAQIMGWSDIRMAMRYTHATGDGIRRAMQLLTQKREWGTVRLCSFKTGPTQESHIKRERAACADRKCLI